MAMSFLRRRRRLVGLPVSTWTVLCFFPLCYLSPENQHQRATVNVRPICLLYCFLNPLFPLTDFFFITYSHLISFYVIAFRKLLSLFHSQPTCTNRYLILFFLYCFSRHFGGVKQNKKDNHPLRCTYYYDWNHATTFLTATDCFAHALLAESV